MKKIAALLIVITMVITLISCSSKNDGVSTGDESENAAPTSADANKVVMKRGSAEITYAEFNLYLCSTPASVINNYMNYYGDEYASYMIADAGLDPTKPYKDQECPYYEGSYLEYFIQNSANYFTELCTLLDYANETGIALDEDETAEAESQADQIVQNAVDNAGSIAAYYGDPSGMSTEEVFRSLYMKMTLADKAKDAFANTVDLSEEACRKEYEENPKEYSVVSYLAYTIVPNDETVSKEDAENYADQIIEETNVEGFVSSVESFHNDVLHPDEEDEEITANTLRKTDMYYTEGDDAYEWMFTEAKVNDTYKTEEEDGSISVFLLLSEPALNDYFTKNVRHILFLSTNYDTDDACREEAERIYKEYLLNPTEENFADLANKYSDDPELGTDENGNQYQKEEKTDGGLYENIEHGKTVYEFDKWCFDSSRITGDTGVIKTKYGYHVMYFVGDGKQITDGTETILSGLKRKAFEEYKDSKETAFESDYVAANLDL
ncbi:MAG: peptidylprolyl isomerase [Clostridia bacterium]|nr:peptidylprolyl isomerase [Clostridia bacterium]